MTKALADTLIRVLQVILAHQPYSHHFLRLAPQLQEPVPRSELGCLTHGDAHLAQDCSVKTLFLHVDRHLVDTVQVLALYHALKVNITESGYFAAQIVIQMLLCPKYEYVRLYSRRLQFLYTVLRRLGLQLAGSLEIGHVCQVYAYGIAAQFPLQLPDSLQKRGALYIAYRASYLGNNKVRTAVLGVIINGGKVLDAALYLIGDMRNHLYRVPQVVPTPLFVNDSLVDTACGLRIMPRGLYAREALIVTQIQVGLHAVCRHIALSMLVRVQRSGVNVDVRVKLLYGYLVSPSLQQLSY